MQFPEIHFGGKNPSLRSYNKYNWEPGETRIVEFYPGKNTPVTLLYTSDPQLYEKLSTLLDGKPISIDLEWAQPYSHSPHPIELFQFSSSKGTIIVATDRNLGYDQIARFLHSCKFFGKGMSSDKKKLHQCCGENFNDIEDIETTRLHPNNLPVNFEALCLQFLGEGTAQFKDHKVQRSDWSLRPLTILQILYGAHDSYAMLHVYHKIIEQYGEEIKPYVPPKREKSKKKSKNPNAEEYLRENRQCHFMDIDQYFVKKGATINYDIESESWSDEKPASLKSLVYKYMKNKGADVKDEDSCFLEHANETVNFLLPTKTKEKKIQVLEIITLGADMFFLGLIHKLGDGTFSCQACDKHLYDHVALIQHSHSRHCKNPFPNHNLDAKDVLLHYMTAMGQAICPFEVVFGKDELQNLTIREAESDDDSEEEDDGDLGNIYKNVIVPLEYDKNSGIKCVLCNKEFDSKEALRDHCWLFHNDIFVKLVTGKEVEKSSPEQDKLFQKLGLFCILQMCMGNVEKDTLVVKCNLCKFCIAEPAKFFSHCFYKHQEFVITRREQYLKWPIRYDVFNESMRKQIRYIPDVIQYNELVENKIYDRKENKCLECNVTFKDEDERDDHFIEKHLIYFPLELAPND